MSLSIVTSPVSVARSPFQTGAGTIVRVRPSALVVSSRLSSTEILSTPIVSIGGLPLPSLMAVTLVTAERTSILLSHVLYRPLPMPAAAYPPVADTVPLWIMMSLAEEYSAPHPMPAAEFPPEAVTLPPLISILPQALDRDSLPLPLPMPAPRAPPSAITVPPSMTMLPHSVSKPPPMPAASVLPDAVSEPDPRMVSVEPLGT